MTNKQAEEGSKLLEAYEFFKYLVQESIPPEKAFLSVVSQLAEDLIEGVVDTVSEDFYGRGFEAGIVSGIRLATEELGNLADKLEEDFDGECTCEECNTSTPDEEAQALNCATCDCDEECQIESYIYRVLMEDE